MCDPELPQRDIMIEAKSGSQPAGIRAFRKWVDGKYCGTFPDSLLARDVPQLHLQALTRESKGKPSPLLMLVYDNPTVVPRKDEDQLLLYIPRDIVVPLIKCLFTGIHDVLDAAKDPSLPRILLNVAWSFEADRFELHPEAARFDTTANTNTV